MSAGFYTLSRMVISTPSSLLGNAINDVYYPRLAQAKQNNEPIRPILIKATKALILVGAFPYTVFFIFSPLIFEIIFGEEWRTAGEYSRWLVLWIYMMFVNGPSVKALIVIGAQKWSLKFTIITLIFRLMLLIIGAAYFKDELIAIILFAVLGFIINITLILQTFIKVRKFDESKGETLTSLFICGDILNEYNNQEICDQELKEIIKSLIMRFVILKHLLKGVVVKFRNQVFISDKREKRLKF